MERIMDDDTSTTSSDDNRPANIHVFAGNSTLHGFSHIFARHHSSLRKFTWTAAFLTSLTLLLFQSSNRVIYYLDFPHVTRLDEVAAGNLSFPAVTICNLNEFRFGNITKNDMYHVGHLLGFLDVNDTLISSSQYSDLDDMEPNLRERVLETKRRIETLTDFSGDFTVNGNFNMFEFYRRTGHDLSIYLLACKYRGTPCNHTWFNENASCSEDGCCGGSGKSESNHGDDGRRSPKPSDFTFFASNSTLHGISHIFSGGRITLRRFLWAVAFFSSLSLFLYQGHDRYSYYRSHPHVTKLDEQEAEIMDFPAVTICNMNSFRLSKVTTDDYYHVGYAIFELFDKEFNLRNVYRDNRTWPVVLQKIKPILAQKMDFRPTKKFFNMFEFYNRTGHDATGVVLSCKYRGVDCRTLRDWDVVFTRFGKCYTFNSGKQYQPLTTLKGGVDNGLELLLDTQQNDYMPVWDETDEISVEAGFKVQIHVQSEPPFIHELGFGVSPGFQTLVATQEQRITFLPSPWGDCVNSFDKEKHYLFENYSISACRITCETKFVLENCSCRMVHMPGNSTYCDPEQYKRCADKALDYLVYKDERTCVCKTPCLVTRYNLEMSTLQLPSTQASSYLAWKYNVSEQYVRDNFVKLNIFFEALNYETIEQKVAYEIAGLLGDIGGQMGLFIGASILTILELFDYVYEFVKDKTWGRKLRRRGGDAEQQPSLAATTSLLVEKDATSNIISPTAHYHAVPGTIAMTFPNRYNQYNGMHTISTPPRQSGNAIITHPNQFTSRSHVPQPYNTMPYRSSIAQVGRSRYVEDNLPPPPPQYLGQSMMTLRGDCGVPEMTLTKRYPGRGLVGVRGRETSLSYNDLVNLGENHTNPTPDEDDAFSRRPNHIPPMAYSSGLMTMPHFNPSSQSYNDPSPSTVADEYSPAFRGCNVVDRQNPHVLCHPGHGTSSNYGIHHSHCISPTKTDYSKPMETDIH